jgi:hypothetical protein
MRTDGKIVGAFTGEQSYASEFLADDDAELLAFLNPAKPQFMPLDPVDFKLGMMTLNVTPDMVDAAIATLNDPDRTMAQIYWTSAQKFYRDDPWLAMISAKFGKTDADIDGAWQYAMSLSDTTAPTV